MIKRLESYERRLEDATSTSIGPRRFYWPDGKEDLTRNRDKDLVAGCLERVLELHKEFRAEWREGRKTRLFYRDKQKRLLKQVEKKLLRTSYCIDRVLEAFAQSGQREPSLRGP